MSPGDDPAFGHLDRSVYLDAAEPVVRRWFVERFFAFRESGRAEPASFYASMAALDDETLRDLAVGVWEAINLPDLIEHIEPTRARTTWVVAKGPDHAVVEITGSAP